MFDRRFVLVILALLAPPAFAQDQAQSPLDQAVPYVPVVRTWWPVLTNATRESIARELLKNGFIIDVKGNKVSAPDAYDMLGESRYDLFWVNNLQGGKAYIVVPKTDGKVTQFGPEESKWVDTSAFGLSPEEIKAKIVQSMQAAIDALCGMKARPTTIRIQASAAGFVDVEGTWEAAEVCSQKP